VGDAWISPTFLHLHNARGEREEREGGREQESVIEKERKKGSWRTRLLFSYS